MVYPNMGLAQGFGKDPAYVAITVNAAFTRGH